LNSFIPFHLLCIRPRRDRREPVLSRPHCIPAR
jgi:hypothetical protein